MFVLNAGIIEWYFFIFWTNSFDFCHKSDRANPILVASDHPWGSGATVEKKITTALRARTKEKSDNAGAARHHARMLSALCPWWRAFGAQASTVGDTARLGRGKLSKKWHREKLYAPRLQDQCKGLHSKCAGNAGLDVLLYLTRMNHDARSTLVLCRYF